MPDKDVMLQIKAHTEAHPWALLDALNADVEPDVTQYGPKTLINVLGLLVEDWRNLASLYERAKLKGAQTTYIVPLRHAAAELDKVIKTLEQPRRAPLGQLQAPAHDPCPHGYAVNDPRGLCGVCDGRKIGAGLDEAQHSFEVGPGGSGVTCTAMVERNGAGDQCGRYASHPAHRLDGPTERPGLDALIASSMDRTVLGTSLSDALSPISPPAQARDFPVGTVIHASADVAAYLRGDVDELPGADPGPSTVRDLTETEERLAGNPELAERIEHAIMHPESLVPYRTAREILETSTLTLPAPPVPPVPLLGQPGNAGDSYAPTYVPPGGVPMTYVELMTPVPAATLPAHLSHSQVETLADCPTKYRATRIGRIEDRDGGADWPETLHEIPQWAFIGGGAFHAAVEKVERIWAQNPNDPFDVVTADEEAPRLWVEAFEAECQKIEATSPVPRARWRASKQGAEGETWWNANGPEMLRRYLAARPAEPTVMLSPAPSAGATAPNDAAIELERTVDVPTPYGAIEYRAILDRVTVRHEMLNDRPIGIVALVIRDYKTGATMPDSTSQLGEYAQVLRLLGMPPQTKILGTYFNARKGTWTPEVDLEAEGWTADWFTWLVSTGYADRLALTTGPTRARPSSYCGGCPVRWACPVKGVKTIASR